MDFAFNEEHRLFRDMVRDFVAKEVRPRARHIDETGEFPWDTIRKMGELGLLGLDVPEEYGGMGADAISVAILFEELGAGCGSTALVAEAHLCLGTAAINLFGNEEQKRRYLPALATGKSLAGLGLTEPGAGSDLVHGVRTSARRDGNEWVINGSKMWLTNAGVAEYVVLLVRTDPEAGTHGMSQIIVPTDTPGFEVGPPEKKMGLHGAWSHAVSLDNVRVPLENLLGEEGRGLHQSLQVLDGGRIAIAALALGIGRAAYEAALRYARERQTFGKPLFDHQAIQFKLAEMATQLEAARWLIYRAAWLKDQGLPYTKEGAMAKLVATEAAEFVTREAIQIHGGYGYSREYEVERMYRDARLMSIGEGTTEVMKMVIGKRL